jgi:hypothetical protein
VVLQHIPRPPPVAQRRPGLTSRGMSAEEQRWVDEMLRQPTPKERPPK